MRSPVRSALFVSLFGIMLFQVGCQAPKPQTDSAASANPTLSLQKQKVSGRSLKTERHADYLALNLPYSPIEALRSQLEVKLGRTLLNRGEAHITIVTPPEFQKFASYLAADEIYRIADEYKMQEAQLSFVCLGRGETSPVGPSPSPEQTYFVVVQSEDLLKLRRAIRDAVVSHGGSPDLFDADHFFPHMTVGFTQRDLHEADGVIKDARSCLYQFAE